MTQPAELTAAQLRRRCDPAQFAFATTAEALGQETIIGQERATPRHRVRHGDALSGL